MKRFYLITLVITLPLFPKGKITPAELQEKLFKDMREKAEKESEKLGVPKPSKRSPKSKRDSYHKSFSELFLEKIEPLLLEFDHHAKDNPEGIFTDNKIVAPKKNDYKEHRIIAYQIQTFTNRLARIICHINCSPKQDGMKFSQYLKSLKDSKSTLSRGLFNKIDSAATFLKKQQTQYQKQRVQKKNTYIPGLRKAERTLNQTSRYLEEFCKEYLNYHVDTRSSRAML